MKSDIKNRFSNALLREAMRRYGLDVNQTRLLGEFDSFVYEFEATDRTGILRICHSSIRSVPLVTGELDWLNHLVQGGATVCQAIPSKSGKQLEELHDNHGEAFIVTEFKKAEGTSPQAGEWNQDSTQQYGQLLGRIHRLSHDYQPPHRGLMRLAWNDPVMLDVEQTLAGRDKTVIDIFRQLLATIEQLPKDQRSYGLIHQDAHGENVKIDASGKIWLYDFFDCTYSWYVNELAIVLFYAAMWEKDRATFTDVFMRHFLTGYRREYTFNASWLQAIPTFLKLREIDLYSTILREFGSNWQDDPWNAGYMHRRKEKIEAGVPYIDCDFSAFADLLS